MERTGGYPQCGDSDARQVDVRFRIRIVVQGVVAGVSQDVDRTGVHQRFQRVVNRRQAEGIVFPAQLFVDLLRAGVFFALRQRLADRFSLGGDTVPRLL